MPIDLPRVKGLCFDVDGTISDTDDAWVERIVKWFAPRHRLNNTRRARVFARRLVMVTESPMNFAYNLTDALSLDDNFARLFERLARKRTGGPAHFILMDGARELLEAAVKHYPLSVVSARDARTTAEFLHQFSIREHFGEVVTNLTCEHTKPYPQPVQHAAAAMQLSPDTCLMIGDTPVDILAGKRAGAQTVGLLCGFGTEGELRRAGADIILNDLRELHKLLIPE
jgi:phosphoglycolate phosphatase-like HAD superfamily hydrolase